MSHISSLKKNAQLYINYFNPQIMCTGQLRLAKERNSSECMTHLQMWKLNLLYRMLHHHVLKPACSTVLRGVSRSSDSDWL